MVLQVCSGLCIVVDQIFSSWRGTQRCCCETWKYLFTTWLYLVKRHLQVANHLRLSFFGAAVAQRHIHQRIVLPSAQFYLRIADLFTRNARTPISRLGASKQMTLCYAFSHCDIALAQACHTHTGLWCLASYVLLSSFFRSDTPTIHATWLLNTLVYSLLPSQCWRFDGKLDDEQLGRGLDYVSRQMCINHSIIFYVCLTKKIFNQGVGVAT
jgi:hypothetical protein